MSISHIALIVNMVQSHREFHDFLKRTKTVSTANSLCALVQAMFTTTNLLYR